MFEHAAIGMALVGLDGRFEDVNRSFCAITGRSRRELLGTTFQAITHPDDLDADLDQAGRLARGEISSYHMEKRYLHADGHMVWVLLTGSAVLGSSGEAEYFIAQVQDITARKAAEEALGRSEAQLRAMAEAWPDFVLRIDRDLRFTYANPTVARATQLPAESFVGRTTSDLGLPRSDEIEQTVREVFAEGVARATEFSLPGPHGRRTIEWRFVPEDRGDGQTRSVVAIGRDVTEQRVAEERFRESQRIFQLMTEAVDDVFWMSEPLTGQLRYLSPVCEKVWGGPCEAFYASPDSFLERVLDLDREKVAEALDKRRRGEAYELDYRMHGPGGGVRWMRERAFPIRDAHGAFEAMTGIVTDVTAEKEAQDGLQRSESMLRQVLQLLPVGVWIAGPTGRIVAGNPAGQEVWGGARYVGVEQYGEYRGWRHDTGEPIAPDDWALARAIRDKETTLREVVRIQAFDGSHKVVLNSAMPLYGPRGAFLGAIVVNEDITALKQAEDQLKAARAALADRVEELEAALSELKVLRGILPICSYCKRIRNDQEFWQQVEDYISHHTEALFSHGVCPACFEEHVRPQIEARRRSGPSADPP